MIMKFFIKKGQSSVEAVHDKFFLYPSFYVFQKKIYPISFTTGNPIVFEEDYAADKMKRKEYKAAQIAREHNDFNHTVWDAYENADLTSVEYHQITQAIAEAFQHHTFDF